MIKKYIKRPYVIEAVQWGGSNYTKDRHDWIFDSGNIRFDEFEPGDRKSTRLNSSHS